VSAEQPKLFSDLVRHLALVGVGTLRTAVWVGPSLFILCIHA
jgi:hypothetical protein